MNELQITYEQDGIAVTVRVNGRGIGTFYFCRRQNADAICHRLAEVKTIGDVVQLMSSAVETVIFDHLDEMAGYAVCYPHGYKVKVEAGNKT